MTAPARGAEEPGDDRDERRLAGAVRAEEREDLAARDVEVDAVHRDEGAEALRDAADRDDGVHAGDTLAETRATGTSRGDRRGRRGDGAYACVAARVTAIDG